MDSPAHFFAIAARGVVRGACTLLLIAASTLALRAADGWTNLLDRDLSQWDTYLSFRHKTDYNGREPVDAGGKRIEPVGYGRNEANVFSVVEKDGRLALRVSGEIYGCLFTKQDFANYRLKLKVKWGELKWDPRQDKLKDSGILYHSVGPAGVDYWRAWMLSQEFQIMEGHMGDYWAIANSAIDIRAFLPEGMMNSVASVRQPFLPFGAQPSVSAFCLRSEDHESAPGEWTELELVCFEDKSVHVVNGRVVMVLRNSRAVTDGRATPLTKGRIQLQSEAAEVFFTDIRIQPIEALPADYAELFR
ncbi:MAG TPA: DUF1080 domain-containing protein [Opitutus sp.]|nr:DUF1080 domain-containing protein [Opitutus sp.]